MNTRALLIATVIGTVLQLAMVLVGHTNPAVSKLFAVLGVTLSLIAGVIYASLAGAGTTGSFVLGGLLSGGVCALLGIAVSCALGDVAPLILVIGTGSSAVTGALGGWVGSLIFRR